MLQSMKAMHDSAVTSLEAATADWLPGLLARFAFAAVLLTYYLNSFSTKIGAGPLGLFVADNAYYQIAPGAVEAAGFDISAVAFLPWGLMVWAGTYAEFILPILVVIGLFTRLAALGMIGFITVQSFVDVHAHKIGAEATGAWFDRASDAVILDQRLMWVTVLAFLVLKGAGSISLDGWLTRR